jgi:RNA polymerase sigma-70 factor (ECF subfamily)
VHPNDPLLQCSDEELLTRLRGGEREVFGVLVRRYQRELYGYLRRYLGDANLADDVFQATFLQVFTKIAQYEPGRAARPWLYTIATHQAIDAMRRVGRHPMVSLEQSTSEGENGEVRSMVEMLESRESNPLDQSLEGESREQVRAYVDKLPEFLRQVVVLVYYQGLKYREVADIIGVPVGTVKSRLHTALLKLQENWTEAPSLPEM